MIDTIESAAHRAMGLLGVRSHYVQTPEGRVHVLDAQGGGRLPTLVLLHGFSAAAIHYTTLLRLLRPHVRRIVVPDFPAHGRSDPPEELTGRGLARGLFAALDLLLDPAEPAVLFGNSMGGHAALRYSLERPARVAGALVCSPGGAAMTPEQLQRFVDGFDVQSYDEALGFIDRLFCRPPLLRPLLAWGVQRKFSHPSIRALLRSISVEDLLRPEEVSAIAVPLTVLWGRQDRILPRAHLDFFRGCLPEHARLEEPDGYAHSPYLDRPREVAQRIVAFCREVAAPGAEHAPRGPRDVVAFAGGSPR